MDTVKTLAFISENYSDCTFVFFCFFYLIHTFIFISFQFSASLCTVYFFSICSSALSDTCDFTCSVCVYAVVETSPVYHEMQTQQSVGVSTPMWKQIQVVFNNSHILLTRVIIKLFFPDTMTVNKFTHQITALQVDRTAWWQQKCMFERFILIVFVNLFCVVQSLESLLVLQILWIYHLVCLQVY